MEYLGKSKIREPRERTIVLSAGEEKTDSPTNAINRLLGVRVICFDSESIRSPSGPARDSALEHIGLHIYGEIYNAIADQEPERIREADNIIRDLFDREEAETIIRDMADTTPFSGDMGTAREQTALEIADACHRWADSWSRRLHEFDKRPARRLLGTKEEKPLTYNGPRVIEFNGDKNATTEQAQSPVESPLPSAAVLPPPPAPGPKVLFGSFGELLNSAGENSDNTTNSHGDERTSLPSLGDLFNQAPIPQTVETLGDELFGQLESGKEIDLRAAARSGIDEVLKSTLFNSVDALTKSLISKLPEDPRFDATVYYNTFLNPDTRMTTPWDAYQNISAYFDAMVGEPMDEFFGEKKD
jgi:hypothetical protein